MKEKLEKEIKIILAELGIVDPIVNFDEPKSTSFGDMSSNVAMMYAKQLDRKPIDLANEIKETLESKNISQIKEIKAVAPGFINFFFDSEYFAKSATTALGEKYGENKDLSGQKTIIEYTDPNPFKEFHIGHLMPNIIGESVSRILEVNGAEVKRANYQGDVGLHVAKAVWATQKGINLNEAYAHGHKSYEEDENAKKEIIEINKKIYDKSDPEINKIYEEGKKKSLDYFELIYSKLGTKFDFYFFESQTGKFGKEVVEKNKGEVFHESDGAVIFKGEDFDKKLHTRVFVTKEGLPTYEAKELGLAKIKYDKYPYDLSIVVTGNEINEYFKVLLKAMSLVFPDLAQKTRHISHGMLKLPEGKMSSRKGNVITAETLISEVREKIIEKMKDRGFDDSKKDQIAEIVAISAIKYSILRQAIGGDIIFDFEKSISFEGDSGPYLQYATVRANSLLQKDEMSRVTLDTKALDMKVPDGWQTINLERLIEKFPNIIERAGREYAPHHIATYLIELAGEFNSFYADHKIIDTDDPTSPYRLAMTKAFAQIMTSGLNLLGIKVPAEM